MRFPTATLVKLVVFALFSMFVLTVMWNTLNNEVQGPTLTYTARFAEASGLRSGDSVRVAGVIVGKVDEIRLVDNEAEVRFRISEEHQLSSDTRILIRYENLIGQRYLSVRDGEGEGELLEDGAQVPADRTEPALDLSVLMNGFDPLFDVLSPEDINKLSTTIVQVLQGEGATLEDLFREVGAISGDIANHDELIGRLIRNLSTVVTRLAAQDDQFEDLVVQTRGLVEGLAADREVIGGSIDSMAALSAEMSGMLRAVRPDLREDLRRAERVFAIYAREHERVSDTIDVTGDFFDRAAGWAQYGSWINLYACHLDVNVTGFEGPLIQGALGHRHSEVCR